MNNQFGRISRARRWVEFAAQCYATSGSCVPDYSLTVLFDKRDTCEITGEANGSGARA